MLILALYPNLLNVSLEKKTGGPITDEDIKEFFSEATESEIESALCGLPKFLDRVKKVLGS